MSGKTRSKHERDKYVRVWEVPNYRVTSPGEDLVDDFLEISNPPDGSHIIDWGCGTGKAGFKLYNKGYDVTFVDFAYNCLMDDIKSQANIDGGKRLRFIEEDINNELPIESIYGFCTDFMEHIPEDEVDTILDNILSRSEQVYFNISLIEDNFRHNEDISEPLHLTVKPYGWWLNKFIDRDCVIHISRKNTVYAMFYLTKDRKEL